MLFRSDCFTEHAVRSEVKNKDEDDKDCDSFPLGTKEERGISLDQTQDDSAIKGASNISNSTKDCGGKCCDTQTEADVEDCVLVFDDEEESSSTRHQATDEKCSRDNKVKVDAHQLRCFLIHGNSTDGLAESGAIDELIESYVEHEASDND